MPFGCIQATIDPATADNANVVSFAQHNVVVSHCTRCATVNHRQFRQLGVQRAMDAACRDAEGGIWRDQFGTVGRHIQQSGHIQGQVGLAPTCRRIGVGKACFKHRLCGGIVEHDAFHRVIEINRAHPNGGCHHQLVVIELQRR